MSNLVLSQWAENTVYTCVARISTTVRFVMTSISAGASADPINERNYIKR